MNINRRFTILYHSQRNALHYHKSRKGRRYYFGLLKTTLLRKSGVKLVALLGSDYMKYVYNPLRIFLRGGSS